VADQLALFDMQPQRCPCGWVYECVLWCAGGHTNGMCPPRPKMQEMTDEQVEFHRALCSCNCYYCKAQLWCCGN